MPIYEYQCPDCRHRFEVLQSIREKATKNCPKCPGKKVERLISHTSFSLKGGGWFKDGYNKKKQAIKKTNSDTNKTKKEAKETKKP